jgi:hypothetical protein
MILWQTCYIKYRNALARIKSTPHKLTILPPNNPRRTGSPDSDCGGGDFDDTNYKLRGKEQARFKEMLEDLLSAVPDALTDDFAFEIVHKSTWHMNTILLFAEKE